MTDSIDYAAIERSFGCDTCKHDKDGRSGDYCEVCGWSSNSPSEYEPMSGSIQEKLYNGEPEKISHGDYLRFLRTGK